MFQHNHAIMPSLKPLTVKLIASIISQPDGCEIHGCYGRNHQLLTDKQRDRQSRAGQTLNVTVITPINNIILVFCDGSNDSKWANMADESVSPTPQFPSTMQKIDFQLSDVDFFHVLWNETLLQTLNVFYSSVSFY